MNLCDKDVKYKIINEHEVDQWGATIIEVGNCSQIIAAKTVNNKIIIVVIEDFFKNKIDMERFKCRKTIEVYDIGDVFPDAPNRTPVINNSTSKYVFEI